MSRLALEPQQDVALETLHSFALPAQAAYFVEIHQAEQILQLGQLPFWSWETLRILGEGSNLLFLDDVADYLIKMCIRGIDVTQLQVELGENPQQVLIKAGAGENWDYFVNWTLSHGFFGLENLSAIPGSVGASPIQNIGAYGVEVADSIERVQVYDYHMPDRGLFWVRKSDCQFCYRDSLFKHEWSHRIIVQVEFRLSKFFKPVLQYAGLSQLTGSVDAHMVRQQVIELRAAKLPDPAKIPNAGSFFKNPIVDELHLTMLQQQYPSLVFYQDDQLEQTQYKLPAAWLLDFAGFKGRWYQEFGCYSEQPLVLIHDKTQRSLLSIKKHRLLAFIDEIRTTIQTLFAIDLEIEPTLVISKNKL